MNWRNVTNFDTKQKFEATMKATNTIMDQMERNIREVKKTTLLDEHSLLWLDWLDSCRSAIQKTIQNKDL